MKSKELIERISKLQELGGHERFYELLLEMADIHAKKNHDYASDQDPLSNLKGSSRLGIKPFTGVLIRLEDKWSRIEQLFRKDPMVKDESITDTLMDNAVYSLLGIILLEEEKKLLDKT